MTEFLSYISDEDLKKEFYRNIQDRHIDQKFLYLDESSVKAHYGTDIEEENSEQMGKGVFGYYDVFKKILSKEKKTAIISLGCGNARAEKRALRKLTEEKHDLTYIGVDISEEMLKEADENLSEIELRKVFLRIDITDEMFRNTINTLTKDCDNRIYVFFGGTLSNVNQTLIADSLYNSLKKDDAIWFDVRVRPDTAMETNMKLFNRYTEYLTDGTEKMCFYPLEKIGVPFDAGKMSVKMTYETSVGALLFIFYFTFEKKVVVTVNGNRIHFLPGEEVKLLNIRTYDPKTLITFFEEHEFSFLHQMIKEGRGQFVFRK